MDKNKQNAERTKNTHKPKKNRFLLIFICIFVSVILVIGGILGAIALIKRSNSAVRYGSYMLDAGEAGYFASYFKYRFLVGLGADAYDADWFWESASESGESYGELLERGYREYVSGILVANALFDRYSKLEKADKQYIEKLLDEAIARHGSKEKFNEKAAKYGFDFDDYETCVEYMYKATVARSAIFGNEGEKLSSFPEECTDYYTENYSRVSLLFLRDEKILEKNEDGIYAERPMTEAEREEREGYISELREAISNKHNGTDGKLITPEMFEFYYKKSDSDLDMYRSYYLADGSAPTEELASAFPEAVEKALSMQIGEYAEVDTSIGVCFIYKEALAESGYTDKDNPFFSDFYSNAVYSIYADMLALYAPEVEFTEKLSEVNILTVPKNYEFIISISR